MTNFIEFNKDFAIEEREGERFLIDNWSKKHTRLVNIGKHNEVSYIKLERSTGYHNFKVTNENGTGLMQLKGSTGYYTDITGAKKCNNDKPLQLGDVIVVPTEYADVSVDHIFERFGVEFPIAYKNTNLCDIFANGHKLENASGFTVFVNMQISKAKYIPQIISYRDDKVYVTSEVDEVIFSAEYKCFPELCFIKNADSYSSIRPSYEEYKIDIWMYNADGKVGIVYLDTDKEVKSYIIDEVPYSSKSNMYFINENYVIYDFHDIKLLYFKGHYIGKIRYFDSNSKHPIFVHTDKGFYIGETFFEEKKFFDLMYLHVNGIYEARAFNYDKVISLRSGVYYYEFKYNSKTHKVVKGD